MGADVRAVAFGNTEGASVSNVSVDNLELVEGFVIGVEVVGDVNDRSDWEGPEVAFDLSEISLGFLKGGAGAQVIPQN
eukprot:UN23681